MSKISTETIIEDLLEFAGDPDAEDFMPMFHVAAMRLMELSARPKSNQIRPMIWADRYFGHFFSLLDSIIGILTFGMVKGNLWLIFMVITGVLDFSDEEQ